MGKTLIDHRNINTQFPGLIICPDDGRNYYKDGKKCNSCLKCFNLMEDKNGKKKSLKMVQLTQYQAPNFIINTQYGNISYELWCYYERKRIMDVSDRLAEVKQNGKNKIALFVEKSQEIEE